MVWRFLKKLGIKLPYDPAFPLLGIYPEETRVEKDTCTPLFITREMQIKTTRRYHLTLVRMAIIKKSTTINAGEGVEKREPSYTVGGNAN